ncbi:MAG TPA: aldo/keto reductase [Opitutaceae bacterium]
MDATSHDPPWRRREFLRQSATLALAALAGARATGAEGEAGATTAPLLRAPWPAGKQTVARIGLGTWQVFDVGSSREERAPLAAVLHTLAEAGGDIVDTSPMYAPAEAVLGELAAETGLRARLFFATKVWTRGEAGGVAQMEESLRKLRTDHVELMQVHNLVDWRTQLRTLRRWKDEGRVGAIGVTHYLESAYDDVERIVRTEPIDCVQLPLSLMEPEAARRVLGACAERAVAFIANRPFGGGGSFRRVRGTPLPSWTAEYGIGSWAQFFLKWILSHPEVTCAIPGTGNPRHMTDNLGAARGRLPDAAGRKRMADFWRSV